MRPVLLILSALSMFTGLGFSAAAKSAIHEIEAFLFYLIAAVLFSAFALLHAIIRVRESTDAQNVKLAGVNAALTALVQLATPPKLTAPGDAPGENYIVQLSEGVRGNFTREQLYALREREAVNQDTWVLPPGAHTWVKLSALAESLRD
jgi:hypothetical protein